MTVKVKQLAWDNMAAPDGYGDAYEIVLQPNGTYEVEHVRLFQSWHRFPTVEAAKAAAQADYEARILAAIDTTDLEAHIAAVLGEAADALYAQCIIRDIIAAERGKP